MTIESLLNETLILTAIISGVPILVSTLLSLGVAIVQSATQVQEQSIGFVVKIASIAIVFALAGSLFCGWIIEFIQRTLIGIKFIGAA